MKLYHAPASPFARKVRLLLHEAGALEKVTLVLAAGNPLDPGTMPLTCNPLGKIPALELDDGSALYDSRVICRYLDETFQSGLYPATPRLWDTLVLEATADGIADAAVMMRYELLVRPEGTRSPDWAEAQWQKIDRALSVIEGRWLDRLAGPLDMGQLALAAALGYLDFRFAHRDWRKQRPGLTEWEKRLAGRPSLRATVPGP